MKTAAKAPDSGASRNDGTGAGMTDNLTTRPNRKRCRRVRWCDGGRMVEAVPLCRYGKSGSLCLLSKGGGRLVAYARLEGRHPPSGVPAYPGDAAPLPDALPHRVSLRARLAAGQRRLVPGCCFRLGGLGFCRHSVASGQSLWRRDDGSLTKPPTKKPCRWRRGGSGVMPGTGRFHRGGLYRRYGQLAGIYAMRQTALSWQYLAGAGRFYRRRPYTRRGWRVTITASWATMARSYSSQSGCSWSPQAIKAARSLRRRSSAGALR